MNALDVGKKLVALCREGKNREAMETLYAPGIVSVEAAAPPGQSRESKGLPACFEKSKMWEGAHEVHSARVEGPFPHGDRFAVFFSYDITQKASGHRFTMDEVALYTVSDGKIVHEEFFYNMG
jgi:hypothetical protein